MKDRILRLLDIEPEESGRVGLLLFGSFFMGTFLATISVASQTEFLNHFNELRDLPRALLVSGIFSFILTILYNFFQNRIPFRYQAIFGLLLVAGLTAFLEFGGNLFKDPNSIYFYGFTAIIPFTFVINLIFWGAFGRMFNLRQAKRLVGTVDLGAMMASFIAYFLIPQALALGLTPRTLYTVSLVSIATFLFIFVILAFRYLKYGQTFQEERKIYRKIGIRQLFTNRYFLFLSVFVVFSMIAVNFVDYSFLNLTTQFSASRNVSLASFIAYFEGAIVVFGFLFQVLATDRITKEYGMKVALMINPILVGFFLVVAVLTGFFFGFKPEDNLFILFFMAIALTKLLIRSLKDSLDNPTFKLYMLPIEKNIRIDVQTKIEGMVTAFASLIAGGAIILISQLKFFDLLYISLFTLPIIGIWFLSVARVHNNYKDTLQGTLVKGQTRSREATFSIPTILQRETESLENKNVLYGLTIMEKIEPALFENTIVQLVESPVKEIRNYAVERSTALGLNGNDKNEIQVLAASAQSQLGESDILSIAPENLAKLSKSGRQADRVLAAKLIRSNYAPKTIFLLLELLRDVDPKVRLEAIQTARRIKRPETWPVLIEMLASPHFSYYAAASLTEVGEPILHQLEAAFHRSGQGDIVMLRIVQIMGRIGSRQAIQYLWNKAEYPDKRIVKQILYSLRYIKYKAEEREFREITNLLEIEISKTIWNLAAISELPANEPYLLLREALTEESKENFEQVYLLLGLIYDPHSIQLVKDNIESDDPDNIAFAMELLDVFIDPELKPKLIPLLDQTPVLEKLKLLQVHFPRESYTPVQVINFILNRDYNNNNRWTKVCAVHLTAYMNDFRVSRGLAAQMFNTDRLLQETASWVIYNKDKTVYSNISERLPQRDKKFLDHSIEKNQLLDGLDDGFFLYIEMVLFIKRTTLFRNIHGVILADLSDKIIPIDLNPGDKIRITHDNGLMPMLICATGKVTLTSDQGIPLLTLKPGDIASELTGKIPEKAMWMEASERTVLFTIPLMDFYFVMANHHELVQGLISNLTETHPVT